jgi:hypothetical protein
MSPAPTPAPKAGRKPAKVKAYRPPKPARKKRNGFVRALQILISIVMMLGVPLFALLLAYGYGNGAPLSVDAENLLQEIRELLGL